MSFEYADMLESDDGDLIDRLARENAVVEAVIQTAPETDRLRSRIRN